MAASTSAFLSLLDRLRAGDPKAAAELLAAYRPEVERVIRLRLPDRRVRAAVDPAALFQSVFANFYVRFLGGQYDLRDPAHLVRLLAKMARNKITDHARRAAKAPATGTAPGVLDGAPAPGDSAGTVLADRELLGEVRRRLAPDELLLAERQAAGVPWATLAAELGREPDAIRKRLERALGRVCAELGVADA